MLSGRKWACAVFAFVVCPPLHYFSTLSKNATIFEKEVIELKMYVMIVYNFETFLILRIIGRDMIKMYIGFHVMNSLLMSYFNETCVSRQTFDKSSNIKFHENSSSATRVPFGWTD
jgi:hypothetical protein